VKRLLLAAALTLVLGDVAAAQPRRLGGPPDRETREELFKMVDAYVVSNLQEGLGLTDEQFVKLLPAVRRLQSVRRDYAERRRDRIAELRRVLESGTGTEAGIAEQMKGLKALELEEPGAVRREVDAVDAQLSPVQQAKLRLLELRFEQRLRELLRRGQGQGAGPRARRPGGGESPAP
jgi:hypothetical protein